jgi:hypothetical protein
VSGAGASVLSQRLRASVNPAGGLRSARAPLPHPALARVHRAARPLARALAARDVGPSPRRAERGLVPAARLARALRDHRPRRAGSARAASLHLALRRAALASPVARRRLARLGGRRLRDRSARRARRGVSRARGRLLQPARAARRARPRGGRGAGVFRLESASRTRARRALLGDLPRPLVGPARALSPRRKRRRAGFADGRGGRRPPLSRGGGAGGRAPEPRHGGPLARPPARLLRLGDHPRLALPDRRRTQRLISRRRACARAARASRGRAS